MKYVQPYGVSDPDASYVNGNPATGTMGSIPPAGAIEFAQREIVNFIADAGITPDNASLRQLGLGIQKNGVIYCGDQGTLNQLVITVKPDILQLLPGMVFIVISPRSNTGPCTLKVNQLAPVPIVRATDGAALDLGDIAPNAMLAYGFDGTHFQMVWSQRQPGAPIYLVAPRTYYVDGTNGNDTYDGQAAAFGNGHGPYRTINKATAQVGLYNLNNNPLTINVADGTYNEGVVVPKQNGPGSIYMNGNPGTPANVHIHATNTSAIRIYTQAYIYLQGFKVSCVGPTAPDQEMGGVSSALGGTWTYLDNMEFGDCTGPQLYIYWNSIGASWRPHCKWTISGSAANFMNVVSSSQSMWNAFAGPDVTITKPVNFTTSFIQAAYSSTASLNFGALAGAGNVTGQRYTAIANSAVNSSGNGPNYYPGTVAGALYAGGVYT